MKTTGIVLCILGCLLFVSGINVAITQYNLNSTHDISKAMGGFGFAILILALGAKLPLPAGPSLR